MVKPISNTSTTFKIGLAMEINMYLYCIESNWEVEKVEIEK